MANLDGEEPKIKKTIATFIKAEGKRRNIPALQVESVYNETTGKFDRVDTNNEEPKHGAVMELPGNEDLKQVLIGYKEQNHNPPLDFDIESCSWKDVFDRMDDAKSKYDERAKGMKGIFRRVWRGMGDEDTEETVTQVMDFIPDDFGINMVKAGLILCFKFAKKELDKREKIINTFEEIPGVIIRAQAMRKHFPENVDLKINAIALYTTLLNAIIDLIGSLLNDREASKIPFFSKRRVPWSRVVAILKEVTTQSGTLKTITTDLWEDLLVKLKQDSEHNKKQVQKVLEIEKDTSKRAVKIESTTDDTNKRAGRIETKVLSVNDKTTATHRTVVENGVHLRTLNREMKLEHDGLNQGIQEVKRAVENLPEALEEKMKNASEEADAQGLIAQSTFIPFLEDVAYAVQSVKSMKAEIESLHEHQSSAMITQELLVQFLGVAPTQFVDDFRYVLQQESDFDGISLTQVHSLLQTRKFRKWSRPNRQELLLVNGNLESAGSERVSAISFLCASLISSLQKVQEHAVSLHFFCGLHTSIDDDLKGPNGLIRSLVFQMVIQLIKRKRLNLEFVNKRSFRDDIERRDLRALCYTCRKLVEQLPLDTPVYCIVDGVDWYEDSEYQDDLGFVIEKLGLLVKNERLRPVFKFLIATSDESRYLRVKVPHEQQVLLEAASSNEDIISERLIEEAGELQGGGYRSTARRPQGRRDIEDIAENWA